MITLAQLHMQQGFLVNVRGELTKLLNVHLREFLINFNFFFNSEAACMQGNVVLEHTYDQLEN